MSHMIKRFEAPELIYDGDGAVGLFPMEFAELAEWAREADDDDSKWRSFVLNHIVNELGSLYGRDAIAELMQVAAEIWQASDPKAPATG